MPYLRFLFWTFIILMLSPIDGNAQFGKGRPTWKQLYKDNDITVDLKVHIPKSNSCVDKNKKFKFEYQVTGKYKSSPTFLNWKISYLDCNGLRYYQENSLDLWKNKAHDISGGVTIPATDKQFTGKQIDKSFYDVKILYSKKESSGLLPPLESKAAKSIKGLSKIFLGAGVELEVEGGELGEDAEWIWYVGGCGAQRLEEGKKVRLDIKRKTTVFVRAESQNHQTGCVQKTIDVDPRSTSPGSILGETDICNGDNTTLSVHGGALGVNAQWVWYSDGCGINKIGTGASINIQPTKTNQYFVRAESQHNITDCASVFVNLNFPVELPNSIQAYKSTSICQGESLTLTIQGSPKSTAYKWYTQSCGGKQVGSGRSINVSPNQTTTYFVRGEGVCNKTICLSKQIKVSNTSILPSSINITTSKKKKALQISNDARLAADAKWKWYRASCGGGTSVGVGPSIGIRNHKKTTSYYVRAEGNCSSNSCRRVVISSEVNKKRNFQNFNTVHYGFGLGLDYNIMEDVRSYSASNVEKLEGIGLGAELYFYPLMKKHFSLGLLGSISVGTSPYVLRGGNVSNASTTQIDKYFFTHANMGTELAFGFSSLKMILKINKEIQDNQLTRTLSNSVITFDEILNREYIGAGLRFGTYSKNQYVDILYLLYRNNKNDFSEFTDVLSNLDNRLAGFQINWKKNNRFTFRTSIYLPTTHEQLVQSTTNDENASIYLSLVFNFDRFY